MKFKVGEKVKVVKLSPEFSGFPHKEFLGKSGWIFSRIYSQYKSQNKYLILFPSEYGMRMVGREKVIPINFYEDDLEKYCSKPIEDWE